MLKQIRPGCLWLALSLLPMHVPAASSATQLEQQQRLLAQSQGAGAASWPGFEPLEVPLAIFDGQRTWLFRHPSPPPGFSQTGTASAQSWVMTGRHEAVHANTHAMIGGLGTATLLLDPVRMRQPRRALAAVALHEAFHVYQRAQHPNWVGNESVPLSAPDPDAEQLALRRQESAALRLALQAGAPASSACWARTALQLRQQRQAAMGKALADYERGSELNEGLAQYLQNKAEGRQAPVWPAADYAPDGLRQRTYLSGASLAWLLDRHSPGWQQTLNETAEPALDRALADALGTGPHCELDAGTAQAQLLQARVDLHRLAQQRARREAEFNQAAGWRLTVLAAPGERLWPQGFDPLNVERLAPARLLHRRYLKLGNAAGKLELLGLAAVTEGDDAAPMFQGVRQLRLTGLPPLQPDQADGLVRISAPGLKLELRATLATASGQDLTLMLTPTP